MIPSLYERIEYIGTTSAPTWTLLGRLPDALSCIETSSINAEWELVMEYPMRGAHAMDIQAMRILYTTQPFFIYRITKNMSTYTMTVYARHVNYLLSYAPVFPFSGTYTPSQWITATLPTCIFNVTSEIATSKSIDLFDLNVPPGSFRDFMLNNEYGMAALYGGEWVFDRFNCTLKERKGSTKDITIRYGVDLIDAKQDESIENLVTHIVPYVYLSDQINATVTLTDNKWEQATSKMQYSTSYSIVQTHPTHKELLTHTPHVYAFTNTSSSDASGTVSLDAHFAGGTNTFPLPGSENIPFKHIAPVNILDDASDPSQLIALNWSRTLYNIGTVDLVSGAVTDAFDNRVTITCTQQEQRCSKTGMTIYYQAIRDLASNYITNHPVQFPVDITVRSLPSFMTGVQLGDTITVEYTDYGISTEAEIMTMEYDVLREQIVSYTLGKGRTSFAETMLKQDNKISRLDGLVTAKNPLKGT